MNKKYRINKKLFTYLVFPAIIGLTLSCVFSTPKEKNPIIASQEPSGMFNTPTINPQKPNNTSSPVPKDVLSDINFILSDLIARPPENGWISYEARIAVQNNGQESVFFSTDAYSINLSSQLALQSVNLNYDDSYIATREGNQYPVTISGGRIFLIPGGYTISGSASIGETHYPLTAEFKVPESLHPSQLIINKGKVLQQKQEAVSVVIDILDISKRSYAPLDFITQESLTANLDIGEKLHMTIESPTPSMVKYINFFPGNIFNGFSLSFPITVKNDDLTNDQSIDTEFYIIDSRGFIYSGDGNPNPIGPGQTKSIQYTFQMLNTSSLSPRVFYLITINNEINKTYTIDVPNLPNCDEVKPLTDGYDEFGGSLSLKVNSTTMLVPGTAPFNFSEDYYYQRISFEWVEGKIMNIEVNPDSSDGSGYAFLVDPANNVMWKGIFRGNSWEASFNGPLIPNLSSVPVLCKGTYSLYLHGKHTWATDSGEISVKENGNP